MLEWSCNWQTYRWNTLNTVHTEAAWDSFTKGQSQQRHHVSGVYIIRDQSTQFNSTLFCIWNILSLQWKSSDFIKLLLITGKIFKLIYICQNYLIYDYANFSVDARKTKNEKVSLSLRHSISIINFTCITNILSFSQTTRRKGRTLFRIILKKL